MKPHIGLIRTYRRNPKQFRKDFKELRRKGASNETIKCILDPSYIPQISRYAVLGGMGAVDRTHKRVC